MVIVQSVAVGNDSRRLFADLWVDLCLYFLLSAAASPKPKKFKLNAKSRR